MSETPPVNISALDARRAARNATALIVASVLSKGLLFGWQLVLAPWLGTTVYGIYNTVGALLVIGAAVTSFSMGLIVIRDVAREPDKAGRYWTAMLIAQTLLGILAYLGINGLAAASDYSPVTRAFTALAGISLFVDLFGNIGYDLLIAQEKMLKTAVVDVVHILVRIGLALALLLAGWGLLGVYLASIFSGIGRAVVLFWLNWRDGLRPIFPLDRAIAIPLLVNSAPLAATGLLALVYQHIDKLMTTAIIGETSTGYIGPAFVISFGVVEVLSTTVLVAVYPMMSRYYGDGKDPTFGFMVEKLALFMSLVSLPIALTLSIYAPQVIAFLFRGGQYAPTAGILSILIWFTMTTMIGNVFAKALLIQNRQRLLMLIRASGLALNIAVTFALLNQYRDPRGAAVGSIVAELLVLSLLVWGFRAVGWDWRRMAPGVLRLIVVGLVTAMTMYTLREAWVIGMVLGLLVYVAGVFAGRVLRDDDWDLIYRLVAAMPFGGLIRRYWKRDVAVNW